MKKHPGYLHTSSSPSVLHDTGRFWRFFLPWMPSGHLGQGCWVVGLLELWCWACCAHAVVWLGEQARRTLQRTEFVHALCVLVWQATHWGRGLGAHWAHRGISGVFKAWGHEKAHPTNLSGSSVASTSNCCRNASNTAQLLSCFLV